MERVSHASPARVAQVRARLEAAAQEVVRRGAIGVAAKITLPGQPTVRVAAGSIDAGGSAPLTGDERFVIERQVVFWLEPTDDDVYDSARFPIYAYEYKPRHICYGFPRLRRGVKASVMHSGEIAATPDKVRRAVAENEVEALRDALRPVLPKLAAAPVRECDTCLFTNTPDHDFIIDWHPSHPNVLISSPCSGHGFKFSSAIGEIQALLLTERAARFDIAPFRIGRFG